MPEPKTEETAKESSARKTEANHIASVREAVLDAATVHVIFDGWSDTTMRAAIADAGADPALAKLAFPRGPVDLAVAFHMRGDDRLAEALAEEDLTSLRYSERVAAAVFKRLEIAAPDKEAVRRGVSLFALPIHAAAGAGCVWHTADTIWNALGDTSRDANWYSKRTILSAVYSASVLYWLGDDSPDAVATRAFVDRRIADVMSFEKTKSRVKGSRAYEMFRKGPGRLLDAIKAPGQGAPEDLPGRWQR